MFEEFNPALIGYTKLKTAHGDAAQTVISPDDFLDARDEITAWHGYDVTPLVSLPNLAAKLGVGGIYFKEEAARFGLGSFKALGGAYAGARVLARVVSGQLGRQVSVADIRRGDYPAEVAAITLCSATDGNHGRSLAWGAKRFGAKCRIYIHAEVSEGRAEAMRQFGADVVRIDGDYDASVHIARRDAEKNGWFVVSDTSWDGYSEPPRDVMAGYGVLVDEVAAQMDAPPSHVFVQGGVGGLAAAIFARMTQLYGDNAPRMVVVEPALAACLSASAKAGALCDVPIEAETAMGGLSCGEPSPMAWKVLRETAGDYLTIPEGFVRPALEILANPLQGDPIAEAGESAIAGLAVLIASMQDNGLADLLGLGATSSVLLIGSEGITDVDTYNAVMNIGGI